MQIQAPSGARKPQKLTVAVRCTGVPRKVVRNATKPEPNPAVNPPVWIRRWAGVQNVSRPIDMCQEISQYTPPITAAAPSTATLANVGPPTRVADPSLGRVNASALTG